MEWLHDLFQGYWDFVRPVDNGWIDYVSTALLVITTIGCLAVVGVLVWEIIKWLDTRFCSTHAAKGVVVDKSYSSGGMIFTKVGDIMVPTRIPPSWHVGVRVDGSFASVSVDKEFYRMVSANQAVKCWYRRGRLFSQLWIEDMEADPVKKTA
jgi:hypothetical protein